MNGRKINNKLVESLLLIGLMTILAAFGMGFLPYVILFPAIFTIFTLRNGKNIGFMNIIATGAVVAALVNMELGIFILVVFLPITLVFESLIEKRRKSSEILLATSVLFFLLMLVMLKIVEMGGTNFVESVELGFNKAISNQLKLYEGMGLTSLELSERKDFLENTYKYALLIIPSILLIMSSVISYLNYVIIAIALEKMQLRLASMPKLSRFRLPNSFIHVLTVILISSFLLRGKNIPYFETTLINLQVLVGFAFIIQGISVLEFLLIRRNVKLWIRTLSYTLFLFLPPLASVLPIIGIMDMIFDIKKVRRSKP